MKMIWSVVAVASIVSCNVMAAPIVTETFDGAGGFAAGGTYFGGPQTVGVNAGQYEITVPGDVGANVQTFMTTSLNSQPATGNYSTGAGIGGAPILGVSFDFYVDSGNDATSPSELNVYFTSLTGRDWRWRVEDYTSIGDGWNSGLGANFGASYIDANGFGSWELVGGGVANDALWLADIGNVSAIGLELGYLVGGGTEMYAFDNFALDDSEVLFVPEPETYFVLAMALLSVAVVFRKRISESLAEARAMLMA
jgi:hypothetical protein